MSGPGGKPLSLWVATAGSTKYASLDADIDVDVAVIGGGIAGLTAALALKRDGQTVAVLEAARVGTGVTGHTTGKVTSLHRLAYTELAGSHGEAAARTYGQANQAAIEHIARTVSGEGLDCGFRRVSNYTYAETDGALGRVRDEAVLAARLGLPSAFTSDVPLPFPVKGRPLRRPGADPLGQVPAGPGGSSPWGRQLRVRGVSRGLAAGRVTDRGQH